MIISVEHKSSPSSYYKGSNSSQSQSEQDENDRTTLAFYEIITDAETLDFMNYYFEDTPNDVEIREFATCICNEYIDMLNDYEITKETFIEELEDKLAKDENSLSFNKLHLYTKDIGFNAYIENFGKEIKQKLDHKEKEENNKEIFTQLLEVKAELEQKDRDLKQKERELKLRQAELDNREREIISLYQDAKTNLENESQRLYKQAENEFKKSINNLNKKITTVERDMRNKTRLVIANKQNLSMSTKQNNMNTSLKSSKGSEDPLAASKRTNDHLKARVANLEKTYEIARSKLEVSEQSLEKERAERNKYQEDYYKIKSKKTIMEKENKDLKDKLTELQNLLSQAQIQINTIEKESTRNWSKQLQRSPDQELKVHDLDDSNDYDSGIDEIPERSTIQQNMKPIKEFIPKKKTPKKLKSFSKATVDLDFKVAKSSKEETNVFIDINSLMISTLNLTLPILLETDWNEYEDANSSFASLQSKGLLDQSASKIMDLYNWSPKNLKDQCFIHEKDFKQ